jgi:hypothetical protein
MQAGSLRYGVMQVGACAESSDAGWKPALRLA